MLTRPAGCGADVVPQLLVQVGPELLAIGAPRVLKSTPDDAVVSLDMIVLLMMFTRNASTIEMPAPSQPATLLTITLLVNVTSFHRVGVLGKVTTSVPLMACNLIPPPLPASAALPIIRLASMTRPGPVPSLGPTEPGVGTQSWSVVAPQSGSTSGAPMIRSPPPLAGIVGFVLWLNTIVLCRIPSSGCCASLW